MEGRGGVEWVGPPRVLCAFVQCSTAPPIQDWPFISTHVHPPMCLPVLQHEIKPTDPHADSYIHAHSCSRGQCFTVKTK